MQINNNQSNYKIKCFISFLSAGSSDVIRVVGGSVQLEINGSVSEFDEFTWIFSGSVNVLKYYKKYKDVTLSPRYKDRVEFNNKTCSLTLKNLQKTDSGLYKVKASNELQTTTLCTYILSVLGKYSRPPVLTVYNSTDPCNITLTCRGHDLSITSSCYKETCEEKEVTSPGGVALSLSVRDGAIICNHSNLVSWKQEKITFTHLLSKVKWCVNEIIRKMYYLKWYISLLVLLQSLWPVTNIFLLLAPNKKSLNTPALGYI
ncbi:SLAM family member 9-like [Astyanax mexicanus]|uniref:SLAM family member 9-like n=1 Tax=Astyanax mexicanus TaxID=7994 RepID=A0A8T2M901_ASTMX|nr:SLAM family member 9-like [Astyanax mexicanus]